MSNTTTSTPQPNQAVSAIHGLIAFSVASVLLVLCLGVILFIRHTNCYSRFKFVGLWCYSKCCCCLPGYEQHVTSEAHELREMEFGKREREINPFRVQ